MNNKDTFSVDGQIVLVSGASRGIGRAIAAGFAQRGAQVVISGRNAETLAKTSNEISRGDRTVRTKVCDVADVAAGQALVDQVVEEFGRIDTLVNCAGVNKRMRAEEYTPEVYDFITNINIRGAYFLALAAGRRMIAAGKGSIINIDSLNSRTPLERVSVYAMAKAAMRQMTKCLAIEWGPRGVRVNGIGPGLTITDLTRPLLGDEDTPVSQWRRKNTPLRRVAVPEDMVGAAIFLASDAASYITGQTLYVDGGATSGLFWPLDG
ncbi:MAG: SDR family NAD(P)-dependent oxidoreductase [Thermoguttaceae bacterium]|jgi:gluconate 5-dehydrogenase